jgi:AraC-like DNA-binding protein
MGTEDSLDHPRFRRLTTADLPCELRPLSILSVLAGQLRVRLADGDAARLSRGEAFVLRHGCVEVVATSPDTDSLVFEADLQWVTRMQESLQLAELAGGGSAALEPAGSDLAVLAQRLLCEERLLPSQTATHRLARTARSLDLLSVALAAHGRLGASRLVGSRSSPHAGAFVHALETLESEGLEECTLGRLAARVGLSERQVARLFRRTLGTSFSAYVTQLRIERAKKLLATSHRSVTEIGLDTGWQSLAHFNTVFRRRVGATPSAYRAIHRKEPSRATTV